MSRTQTITIKADDLTSAVQYTDGAELNISVTVAAGANTQYKCALIVADMKALLLYSNVDATVYVNDASGGSPTETIALKAGQAVAWSSTNGQSNPLGSTDVTDLYITNAADAAFELRAIFDPEA